MKPRLPAWAEGMARSAAGIAAWLLRFLRPRACALGGALIGLAADWYGLLAGLLLGSMLDEARAEAAARAAIATFLLDPEAPFPAEPLAGLAAAAALALGGPWPGGGQGDPRSPPGERALFESLARAALPGGRAQGRELERILERVEDLGPGREASRPALARALATRGSAAARILLADYAYALAASAGPLDRESELGIRSGLADCGLTADELPAAREKAFPGYRDPWELLGLEPGSAPAEIKRAYRRLSRKLHPDAQGGGADPAAFRKLREAYEELCRKR